LVPERAHQRRVLEPALKMQVLKHLERRKPSQQVRLLRE